MELRPTSRRAPQVFYRGQGYHAPRNLLFYGDRSVLRQEPETCARAKGSWKSMYRGRNNKSKIILDISRLVE